MEQSVEYSGMPGVGDRTYQTYRRVREMILSNELPSGFHLKQAHLARRLKVSQTPVREAMKLLEREGWVVSTFNKGKIVRTFTAKDLQDVYEIREVLEGLSARKVAAGYTDEQITHLETLALIADRTAPQETWPTGMTAEKADMEFHLCLAKYAGNQQVIDLFQRMVSLEKLLVVGDIRKPTLSFHIHIVQAIKSREPEWAELVARRHIRQAYQNLSDACVPLQQLTPDGRLHPLASK